MTNLILIIVSAALVNNVVLSQFLGICSFLDVSKQIKASASLGGAVIFVLTLASAVASLLYDYVLDPLELEYLKTIVFILVIAALVQLVEVFLKKTSPGVCQALGIYLPLITTNCAVLAGLSPAACAYGCLGLGSCVKACPQDAIRISNGLAHVNPALCVGCGLCAAACPKDLISLVPAQGVCSVNCSSRDKGPAVRKVCAAGCIGCGLCVKQCQFGAVTLENNLARIDPDKCSGCGACAEKCPVKVISGGTVKSKVAAS